MFMKDIVRNTLIRLFRSALKDEGIRLGIWDAVNRPPTGRKAGDIQVQLYRNALEDTAEYVEHKMMEVHSHADRNSLLKASLSVASNPGLYLEFGVASGKSINTIAGLTDRTIHGFDSFEGLPEYWFDRAGKGAYTQQGKLPLVKDNVKLHAGLFEQTLPKFATAYTENISFMHVDCDIYSSTKTVFDVLGPKIKSGTVIQFDEYFNYPGWRNHEYKAFQEFINNSHLSYDYLGYTRSNFAVAVIIK